LKEYKKEEMTPWFRLMQESGLLDKWWTDLIKEDKWPDTANEI